MTFHVIALQEVSDVLSDQSLTRRDWLVAFGILVASLIISFAISKLLRRIIEHGIGHGFASIAVARFASYLSFLLGLFYAMTTLGVRVGPLLGALGLGGIVFALALQGVVENFVSSVILQARRPYTIGDSVELDGHVGVVTDIDSRTTLLRSLDGTQVRIPNSNVTSSTIVNLTREPIRRSTLQVGVAYNTDLLQARTTLIDAIGRVPRVLSKPAPMVHVTGFDASSIGFEIHYWHESDIPSGLAARTDLAIAVHTALDAHGVDIAFPQLVVWNAKSSQGPVYESEQHLDVVELKHKGIHSSAKNGRKPIAAKLRRPVRRQP